MTTMAAARGTWRVLVVDDEENLNWSLVNSLRREGYVSDGALTGEEAQRRLSETYYDCVISDVKMPGMDGFELFQWIRRNRPATRIIMMTAFGSPSAREEALRGGVIAYLEKPFDLRALKEELRRLAGAAATATPTEGYDPLEVVRVLNLSRRDIAVSVQTAEQTGTLLFVRGDLYWADAGNLTGDEAFLALCAPRTAWIQPRPWDGRVQRNVTLSVSRLIYLALARREGLATRATPPVVPAAEVPTSPGPVPLPAPAVDDRGPAPPPVVPVAATADAAPTRAPVPATAPLASTGSLAMPETHEQLLAVLREASEGLVGPLALVVLRSDGVALGQILRDMESLPAGVFTHLASAAQAAGRALLVGDLGTVDALRITTPERELLLRRLSRGDRIVLEALLVPREADLAALVAQVSGHDDAVLDALTRPASQAVPAPDAR